MPDAMTLDEAAKIFPPIWTIYDRPEDHPEHVIVRMWFGLVPHPEAGRVATIEEARRLIRMAGGSVCLPRGDDDAPCIVESWL